MEIIVIVLIIFDVFLQLYILKTREKPIENPKEDKKTIELTEEQKKKQEKLRKSFESLMGYGYENALKGGEIKEDR